MKIMYIAGARPNFIKVSPIMAEMALRDESFDQVLVHTRQHYDTNVTDVFLSDSWIPAINESLNVGSGSNTSQTTRIMLAFEPILLKHKLDWVLVVGDVNSTLAGVLVAAKLGVRIAHVEAGLRRVTGECLKKSTGFSQIDYPISC